MSNGPQKNFLGLIAECSIHSNHVCYLEFLLLKGLYLAVLEQNDDIQSCYHHPCLCLAKAAFSLWEGDQQNTFISRHSWHEVFALTALRLVPWTIILTWEQLLLKLLIQLLPLPLLLCLLLLAGGASGILWWSSRTTTTPPSYVVFRFCQTKLEFHLSCPSCQAQVSPPQQHFVWLMWNLIVSRRSSSCCWLTNATLFIFARLSRTCFSYTYLKNVVFWT